MKVTTVLVICCRLSSVSTRIISISSLTVMQYLQYSQICSVFPITAESEQWWIQSGKSVHIYQVSLTIKVNRDKGIKWVNLKAFEARYNSSTSRASLNLLKCHFLLFPHWTHSFRSLCTLRLTRLHFSPSFCVHVSFLCVHAYISELVVIISLKYLALRDYNVYTI